MSFTLKRGLSNIFIAEVTADTDTEFTTGNPEKLIPAGEMNVAPNSESTPYHFDNSVFAIVSREGGSELSITGAGLRAAAIAKLNNKTVDEATGAVFDEGVMGAVKYFALGAEKDNIDGTKELVWFLKGTFEIPEESAKTVGEDTDASGTTLTYTAVPTVHKFAKTGKVCKRTVIDTETTTVKTEADWFAQVVTPDNAAEIVQKAGATA